MEKKTYYAHLYDNELETFFNIRRREQDEEDRKRREEELEGLKALEEAVNEWRRDTVKEAAADAFQVGGDHYKKKGVQPWDIVEQYSLNFFAGNVVKYILRYQFKNGLEDLQKAEHYIKKLIEIEKAKENPNAVASR